MSPLARIGVHCIICVLSLVALSVGISALSKYRNDRNVYSMVSSFSINATCTITSVDYLSLDPNCMIFRYSLNVSAATNASLHYFAFSNFFSDVCGGVLIVNSTGTPTVPCFLRSLNTTLVRITAVNAFLPQSLYAIIGVVLVLCGALPPLFLVSACLYTVVQRCVLWWRAAQLLHEQQLAIPAGRTAAAGIAPPTAAGPNEPAEWHMTELSPRGEDWVGRLITKTAFAEAAAQRLRQPRNVRGVEECPLCFKCFDDAVVWWTCGHMLCDECGPRTLAAETGWGHSGMPRCPLCRERSDIFDIVKIKLSELPYSPTNGRPPAPGTSSSPFHDNVVDGLGASVVGVADDAPFHPLDDEQLSVEAQQIQVVLASSPTNPHRD